MLHLRIVAPSDVADRVLGLLERTDSVVNVVRLRDAASKPDGDLLLCDVAREDASVVLSDLRALDVHRCGSIAVEEVTTAISDAHDRAEQAAKGAPSDAVVWEQVQERTSEESSLSGTFLAFMVLAMLIAAVGIFLDSEILVVGAMVVGPEFGPIAGLCVALVSLRGRLSLRSAAALLVGFPLGVGLTLLTALAFKATGVTPDTFTREDHGLSTSIANPDFLAFFVAFCAGAAGMLSLSTAKSGALIGVLISVTTIPAAANVAVATAYGDWDSASGSLQQLGLNVAGIVLAGVLTLWLQRLSYLRRRASHRAALRGDAPAP
ncbi:DUF389 domain-containing protein [Conexibacter sp. SYSU D00693]|uniref:DUF389 domain-containing protein n=1 Tax=Conexibacter sp. SYSU D00693 TaxID=2812560 RepID=UPI00196B8D7C|nr:DUF389 domain-containing protein [Conexibacter sp. SYSU D00693]